MLVGIVSRGRESGEWGRVANLQHKRPKARVLRGNPGCSIAPLRCPIPTWNSVRNHDSNLVPIRTRAFGLSVVYQLEQYLLPLTICIISNSNSFVIDKKAPFSLHASTFYRQIYRQFFSASRHVVFTAALISPFSSSNALFR